MKKIVLVMIVMACWITQTDAQIKFGVKGGLNFDNFDYSAKASNIKNANGWQAGVLLQVKVPIIGIGVQPELLYTVKSAKINGQTNSISYFEVPINARWELNLIAIRPFIMGGPYFGYAANFKGDVFKNIQRFDWGIGLGGGVEIWKLQLAMRYSWGLQNVSDATNFDLKNRTFSLSLGLLF